MSDSLWPHGLQHARLLCPPVSPRVCSNSCPLGHWCYLAISSSLSSPSLPALTLSQHQGLFQWVISASGGLSVGASALASALPMNIQGWFSLELTGLIALLSKGPSCLLQHHSSKASILGCSTLWMIQLTSIHDHWKNHSFDYKKLCLCFLILV